MKLNLVTFYRLHHYYSQRTDVQINNVDGENLIAMTSCDSRHFHVYFTWITISDYYNIDLTFKKKKRNQNIQVKTTPLFHNYLRTVVCAFVSII